MSILLKISGLTDLSLRITVTAWCGPGAFELDTEVLRFTCDSGHHTLEVSVLSISLSAAEVVSESDRQVMLCSLDK